MPPGEPIPRQDEGSDSVWWATGLETPVFFDERGHRARLVRFFGACSLLLVAGWLALVVSGPVGFGSLNSLNTRAHHHTFAFSRRHDFRTGVTEAVSDTPAPAPDPKS